MASRSDMGGSCIDTVLLRLFGRIPARISFGMLAFMGFVVMTSVRINMSIAIVAMVPQNDSSALTAQAQCLAGNESRWADVSRDEDGRNWTALPTAWSEEMAEQQQQEDEETEEDEFLDWDSVTQGLVLASFFYGYAFTQVIGGRFAEVYGTRITFGICGLTSGFFTLLCPVAAKTHYGVLIAARVLMGFFQGPMWPSMHAALPRWIPPLERSRFISYVQFGANLSIMLTMAITGVIVDSLGWEAAFYIPGTICSAWALCWLLLVVDDPRKHPRISAKELEHIENSVRKAGSSESRPRKVPWKKLFSCIPFWAIIAAEIGSIFGLGVYFTHLPIYMNTVLGFSLKENGLLSSLPFLSRYIGGITFASLNDWLLKTQRISLIASRRIGSAISMFIPAALIIATAYSGCSATLTIIFICLALFANGAIVNSTLVNYMDISPNFSGTLFGIGNSFAALTMFFAPVCVGAIIQGEQTMEQWRKVFWTCVPIYIIPEIIYLCYCSTSVQPWNSAREEDEEEEEKEKTNGTTTLMLQET